MIVFIDRAGLYRSELSSSQQSYAVMLPIDHQFHGRGDYLLRVTQKFTTHLVREGDQRRALLLGRLVVHKKHSLRRIGIRVRIAQRRVGMHSGGDGQAIQRNAVPASALDVPCQDGLIAHEVDFAIGETLAGVDVRAAGLDVIATNLLAERRGRKSQKRDTKKVTKAM